MKDSKTIYNNVYEYAVAKFNKGDIVEINEERYKILDIDQTPDGFAQPLLCLRMETGQRFWLSAWDVKLIYRNKRGSLLCKLKEYGLCLIKTLFKLNQ